MTSTLIESSEVRNLLSASPAVERADDVLSVTGIDRSDTVIVRSSTQSLEEGAFKVDSGVTRVGLAFDTPEAAASLRLAGAGSFDRGFDPDRYALIDDLVIDSSRNSRPGY